MEHTSLLALTAQTLRDPRSLIEADEDPQTYARIVPQLLLITVLAAGVFGATVGSYRGGIQTAYAALKAPILFVLPLLVALPAIQALWASAGAKVPLRRLALAGAVGMARMAVLAAAMSPVLWLLYSLEIDYHLAILLLAGALVLAALPAMSTLGLAMDASGSRWVVAMVGTVGLFGLLGAQTGWVLRPFVARPTAEVTLLRAVEADVFDALDTSAASAVGVYGEWEAQPSGAIGELQRDSEVER